MFGHDDHHNNNDDKKAQITLPPTEASGQDDQNDGGDNAEVQGSPDTIEPTKDTELGDLVATSHRGDEKSGAPTDDLLDIKQNALQALTPLVDHLVQTPEEKFRTTMMMIQASDNHSLIKLAYDAAQKISSDKERAQALLDIVNEINYFTQQQS